MQLTQLLATELVGLPARVWSPAEHIELDEHRLPRSVDDHRAASVEVATELIIAPAVARLRTRDHSVAVVHIPGGPASGFVASEAATLVPIPMVIEARSLSVDYERHERTRPLVNRQATATLD